ncbi:ricin-type beta-trefoil lectin domain protein [Streptomyces sp. AP-93]|uniref:ricin-type beta-trefoil lectin domain protein n=1 Tax=Streptomyces sp. AP-93 TaxID=2929048 RepID=UPI001FAF1692|nr:ricin-type beta-trefoil lectin domain protein [Streptomyces sp. AP-93]MCJ0867795.1 ricin-type beta-trefoil lectin domain protein [Streptomyces sp. AP-93]
MRRLICRRSAAIGLITAACLVAGLGTSQAKSADSQPKRGHGKAVAQNSASNASGPNTWGSVPIGGGGYVTGMVAHPAEKDLVYTRTDVGGAYRWNAGDQSWTPITDSIKADDRDLYRIESLAVAPTEPGTVYLAAGSGWDGNSSIMKSTDRGNTWTTTRLGIVINGNAGGDDDPSRSSGERLAVDPGTSGVVYFGSRNNGLWRSGDAGATWARDTRLSVAGTPGRGVVFTLFARTNEAAGAPTRTVYAAVYDDGMYRSTDAGATWSRMAGSPVQPNRAALVSNGDLYVTHKTGIAKFSGGTWNNVTPPSAAQYNAISVDPANPSHVVTIAANGNGTASPFYNPIFRSTDGAATWTQVQYKRNNTVPWWPDFHWSASTASVTIDPFRPGRVWYTDWYGVWKTDDITVSPSTWTNFEKGHEEAVVVSNITSPPSGDVFLHSGVADNGGYDHTSLTDFPAYSHRTDTWPGTNQPRAALPGTTTGIDFSEADPKFLVRVGRQGNSGNTPIGGYSTDAGKTYTKFNNLPEAAGRVAVSAASDRIVWAAQGTGDGKVRYSTNRGTSWTLSAGAPSGLIPTDANWTGCQPLASDRVDGNKFYIYKAGKFYRSTNGGATFTDTGASGLPSVECGYFEEFKVAAAPGINGEVWINFGWNGIYRSTDSGATFTKVNGITAARVFGFGKGPKPNSPSPAAPPSTYLHGIVGGVDGIFRSDDLGATWTRINTTEAIGARLKDMTGDRQVFGRAYIATDGRGIYYGAPAGAPNNGPQGTITGPGGKCVDVLGDDNGTAGAPVVLWDCLSSAKDQQWTHRADGTLRTLGRCLDIDRNETAPGTPVQLWDCNGGGNQVWAQQADGSLRNPRSGLCLDAPGGNTANGTRLQIWHCNGLAPQKFFVNGGAPIIGPGGKCVDVAGDDNGTAGAPVMLWDCLSTAKDMYWTHRADGTLRTLGRCLDIDGNSTAPGALVQLWDCNGAGGQVWAQQADGSLRNPQSGLCLDAPGGNTANGTRLQTWHCNGLAAQKFQLQ